MRGLIFKKTNVLQSNVFFQCKDKFFFQIYSSVSGYLNVNTFIKFRSWIYGLADNMFALQARGMDLGFLRFAEISDCYCRPSATARLKSWRQ